MRVIAEQGFGIAAGRLQIRVSGREEIVEVHDQGRIGAVGEPDHPDRVGNHDVEASAGDQSAHLPLQLRGVVEAFVEADPAREESR